MTPGSGEIRRDIKALNRTSTWLLTVIFCAIDVISAPDLACQCLPALAMESEGEVCPEGTECGPRTIRCLCNDAGFVALEESDSNGDGNVDTQTHFSYCTEGHLLQREVDRGLDGSVEERHAWVYVDGNLEAYEFDRDADGVVDSRTSYFTGPEGVVLWEESDADGDGIAEERITFAYEGSDRVSRLVDVGADGTIERECQYDPTCPPPYSWESCIRTLYCGATTRNSAFPTTGEGTGRGHILFQISDWRRLLAPGPTISSKTRKTACSSSPPRNPESKRDSKTGPSAPAPTTEEDPSGSCHGFQEIP